MPKPFRIAMIPTASGGVNYYRMAAWAFQMRKYRNVEVAVFEFQYGLNEPHPWQKYCVTNPDVKFRIEHLCKAADVTIWGPVQYEHTISFFNEMRQKYGKLTLIDMDDNHVDVPTWNEAFHSYGPNSYHRRLALESLRMADGVIVSTPHLKELYSHFNENIELNQNSLDFKGDKSFIGWDKASPRKHKGLRIGWIGGRSHFDDLAMIAPMLRELLIDHPEVQLCLVNSALQKSYSMLRRPYPFEGLKNVQLADRSVPINRYSKFAAHFGFDIGIAPLVDCNFNRSKSNLRWLEYSAMGIPSVCSDISHFSQTVRNNEDGILIKDNDMKSWRGALEFLISNKDSRQNMGRMAARRVRRDFNVKKNAATYFRTIKKLYGQTLVGDVADNYAEVA